MTLRPCELIPEDIPQGVVPLHFLKTSGVCIELANTLFLLELKQKILSCLARCVERDEKNVPIPTPLLFSCARLFKSLLSKWLRTVGAVQHFFFQLYLLSPSTSLNDYNVRVT
jgi:hypothetical protein